MNVYTSYFAKLRKLPSEIVPIAICGRSPDWYKGNCYPQLAPKYQTFQEWKKTHNNDVYVAHFNIEVLDRLDANQILKDFMTIGAGKDIAMICYEKPGDFCHRILVADWITRETGIIVKEYEFK